MGKIANRLAYAALAAVAVWPWLAYDTLFAPDEYVHLYNACALERLGDPDAPFAAYLRPNRFPEPNWFGHGWLLLATRVAPPWLAEKAFPLLLALGVGYAFLGARPRGRFAGLYGGLALLCLLGATWAAGFVNYLTGMVAVLAALTHLSRPRRHHAALTFAWAALCYVCHPIALLFFAGTLGLRDLLANGLLSTRLWPRGPAADWWGFARRVLLPLALPLALVAAYVATHSEVSTLRGASPWRLLMFPYFFEELTLFSSAEAAFAKTVLALAAVAGGVAIAQLLRRGGWRRSWWLVGAGVLGAAIVLAPDYFAGGGLIHQRLVPVAFAWALYAGRDAAWAPRAGYVRALPALLGVVLLAATTGLTRARLRALAPIYEAIVELRNFAGSVPAGSVVLPVQGSAVGFGGVPLSRKPVFHHLAAELGCERSLVLLDNYEAFVGYFPLLWREGRDPFRALSRGLEAHPARLDPAGGPWLFEHAEYVLALGPLDAALEPETAAWLKPVLTEVAVSPSGRFTLYRLGG